MLLKLAVFIGVLAMLYCAAFFVVAPQFDAKGKHKLAKNVLFVTAHPDDECM